MNLLKEQNYMYEDKIRTSENQNEILCSELDAYKDSNNKLMI